MRKALVALGVLGMAVATLASRDVNAAPPGAGALAAKADPALRLELVRASAQPMVSMFVKTTDVARTTSEVSRLGGAVGTVSGDVLTVRLSRGSVGALASVAHVARIEGARRVHRRLDKALPETKVSQVHSGAAGSAYKGAGVVVGVIDYGLDLGHDAFKKAGGASRVIGVWDQGGTGTPPQGYTYGAECDPASIAGNTCLAARTDSHGTHVAGIAAGGPVAGTPYVGVAPEADIVFVHLQNKPGVADDNEALTTAICDGAAYVFKAAQARNEPAVINMSLGEHSGPHDGTSLADQCLDNLTGPGKIIVAAAGNEGQGSQSPKTGNPAVSVHASGTAAAGASTVRLLPSVVSNVVQGEMVVWFDAPGDVSVRIGADDGNGNTAFTAPITRAQPLAATTLTVGALTLGPVAGAGGELPSGARGIQIQIGDQDANMEELNAVTWILEVTGAGKFDAFFDTTNGGGFLQAGAGSVAVDNRMTIGYPAIATKVIAVGSYVLRNAWTPAGGAEQQQLDNGGQPVVVGALSGFSSRGPARRNTAVKQALDITAPGELVVSALNSRSTPNALRLMKAAPSGFLIEEGTSMASPVVAGVVALMLQKNPTLPVDEVRRILVSTATAPQGEVLPNDDWGSGKVDALAAVQAVTAAQPGADAGTSNTPEGGADLATPPASSPPADTGGCGCRAAPAGGAWLYAGVGAFALALVALRRRARRK